MTYLSCEWQRVSDPPAATAGRAKGRGFRLGLLSDRGSCTASACARNWIRNWVARTQTDTWIQEEKVFCGNPTTPINFFVWIRPHTVCHCIENIWSLCPKLLRMKFLEVGIGGEISFFLKQQSFLSLFSNTLKVVRTGTAVDLSLKSKKCLPLNTR